MSACKQGAPLRGSFAALRRFRRDDHGGAAVEFVLWVPFFAFLLSFITDLAIIYTTHSSMWDAARDGARRLSMQDATEAEVETIVAGNLALGQAQDFTVTATDGLNVRVVVSAPMNQVSVFGVVGAVLDTDLSAAVTMRREPTI